MKIKLKHRIIAVIILAALTLPYAANAALAAQATPGRYIHEQPFAYDHQLTGLFDSFTEQFNAGDWTVLKGQLTLCFAATPLVRHEVSDFTVSLNGKRFYSARIPVTKGEVQQMVIDLPAYDIQEGANSIYIETYIRTNENDPCKEDVSNASWMTVLSDSFVSLSYTSNAKVDNVADFYKQFTSLDALENKHSSVFVAPKASESELTAASWILSGVSSNAIMYYDHIELNMAKSLNDMMKKPYAIYVAEFGQMIGAVRDLLSAEQLKAAEENAVVALLKTSGGTDLLVVTGTPEGLKTAGRLFGNKIYIEQTLSTWRKIFMDENVTAKAAEDAQVRQLTTTGIYYAGPFRQSHSFYIQSYANRLLKAGSKVELSFRYSQNLDFNRSLITVYLNEVPIGSKRLMKENAPGDTVSFVLPDNLQVRGNFTITVAFDLEIPDMECTPRQMEMPWAFVDAKSMLYFYSEDAPYLLYEYYPAPFIKKGSMNDVVAIIPDAPGGADMKVLATLMLTMGRFQLDNAGGLRVCTASNMGDLSNKNVIVIGRFEKNPIVQQINNQMFFQFTPEGTTLRSNEKMLLDPNYGATLGTGQLLYSPYSTGKYALMLISGVTDQGMQYAGEYMGSIDNLWKISGDGYLADSVRATSYRFKDDNAKAVSAAQHLSETPQLLTAILLTVGVLVLLCTAILLVMIKYKSKKKELT